MTSKIGGGVVGNIEDVSKNVTSAETKYQCVLGE